jgi:hypothetical protein
MEIFVTLNAAQVAVCNWIDANKANIKFVIMTLLPGNKMYCKNQVIISIAE